MRYAGAAGPSIQLRRKPVGEIMPDLADRHGARIEAQDLVVETVEPRLSLGD
jgi:hypothetical protein